MNPLLRSTLLKVAIPAAAALVPLLVTRKRGISWTHELGFARPTPRTIPLWLGVK